MKPRPVLAALTGCWLLAACSEPEPGLPMELARACAVENEKKVFEISGFLSAAGSVYCSNRSGRMECGFRFTETPGAAKGMSAYIAQGSGANSVEKLKSGYRREDIKIRDHAGNLINLDQKVKITGKMSVTPDLSVCFIDATTIRKP
jgi:hypothetical protein